MAYFDQYDDEQNAPGIRRTLSPWLSMYGGAGMLSPAYGEAAPEPMPTRQAYQFGPEQPISVAQYSFGDEPDPSAESKRSADQLGQSVLETAKHGNKKKQGGGMNFGSDGEGG